MEGVKNMRGVCGGGGDETMKEMEGFVLPS